MDYCQSEYGDSGYLDAFENPASAQFHHRWIAALTFGAVIALGMRAWRGGHQILGGAVIGAVTVQFLLGIATLLHGVPVSLGGMHQAGAIILLGTTLALAHAQYRAKNGRKAGLLISFFYAGTRRICNSASAFSSTSDGAAIIKSSALPFIGNKITSRIFGSSAISITIRSMPGAIPPCGGAPKAERINHRRKFFIDDAIWIASNLKRLIHHIRADDFGSPLMTIRPHYIPNHIARL